jgi:hypothetical protein
MRKIRMAKSRREAQAGAMKPTATLAALFLTLAGCAVERAQVAGDAKARMVGMSRERVLACMGPPGQRLAEGKTEVWSYASGGQTIAHAFGDANTTGSAMISGNSIYGNANTTSSGTAIAERRYCIVNIVMADGTVGAVNYSGPTGGLLTGGEQCAYAVRGCVEQ